MGGWQTGVIIHGIGTPGREQEPGESRYWLTEVQFVMLLDMIAALPDPGRIRITFDDGNLSDHDIALPALIARGLVAEFFVLSGRIDQAGSLGVSHIRALLSAGMSIGSHGVDHVDWRAARDPVLEAEVRGSRARLEEVCDRAITTAGVPFGHYDGRVLNALKQAGYTRVYSSDMGKMHPDRFVCPRSSVHATLDQTGCVRLLSGQMSPYVRLRRAVSMRLRLRGLI
ncbi:MAG: polysaccharide deacetylase family protein [Rhizobiales bacterium]|nr:polysaccharide deacetylase family protein [Hyphomicrobiales bacterium]